MSKIPIYQRYIYFDYNDLTVSFLSLEPKNDNDEPVGFLESGDKHE